MESKVIDFVKRLYPEYMVEQKDGALIVHIHQFYSIKVVFVDDDVIVYNQGSNGLIQDILYRDKKSKLNEFQDALKHFLESEEQVVKVVYTK